MRSKRSRARPMLLVLMGLALLLMLVPQRKTRHWRSQIFSALQPLLSFLREDAAGGGALPVSIVRVRPGLSPALSSRPAAGAAEASLQDLQAEVTRLRDDLARLRSRLGVAPATPRGPAGMAAPVIARQIFGGEPILGIGLGSESGVRVNAGVLYRGAVLGRIISVGPRAACLALLSHRGLRVAARLAECRVQGVLEGAFRAESAGRPMRCRLRVVSHDLRACRGEKVVTSGLDGHFPPGCWIGTVESIERRGGMEWELAVRLACPPQDVEWVYVLSSERRAVPWPGAPGTRRRATSCGE